MRFQSIVDCFGYMSMGSAIGSIADLAGEFSASTVTVGCGREADSHVKARWWTGPATWNV